MQIEGLADTSRAKPTLPSIGCSMDVHLLCMKNGWLSVSPGKMCIRLNLQSCLIHILKASYLVLFIFTSSSFVDKVFSDALHRTWFIYTRDFVAYILATLSLIWLAAN